jgi:hypothetical protein
MHLTNLYPARRIDHFILVVVLPLLVGCGGGGGSSIIAPPISTTNLISQVAANQVNTDQLFAKLGGEGERWIAVMDSDSLNLRLDGNADNAEAVLRKLPPIAPYVSSEITTRYSRFGTLSLGLDQQSDDPGRIAVWGYLSKTLLITDMTYDMTSLWHCVGCGGVFETRTGIARGDLTLMPEDRRAMIDLIGDDLNLAATLQLDKNNQFHLSGDIALHYEGIKQNPDMQMITGALFGPDASEAGLVFGIETDQGLLFSGMAIGASQ